MHGHYLEENTDEIFRLEVQANCRDLQLMNQHMEENRVGIFSLGAHESVKIPCSWLHLHEEREEKKLFRDSPPPGE